MLEFATTKCCMSLRVHAPIQPTVYRAIRPMTRSTLKTTMDNRANGPRSRVLSSRWKTSPPDNNGAQFDGTRGDSRWKSVVCSRYYSNWQLEISSLSPRPRGKPSENPGPFEVSLIDYTAGRIRRDNIFPASRRAFSSLGASQRVRNFPAERQWYTVSPFLVILPFFTLHCGWKRVFFIKTSFTRRTMARRYKPFSGRW